MGDGVGPPLGLRRGDEGDVVVTLSAFGGIRLLLNELVGEHPGLGPSLFAVISTGKVVMSSQVFLQRLSGTMRSL